MSCLVVCDYFLPGTQAGGPVSSIYGLSELFRKCDVATQIVTKNSDWKKHEKYDNVTSNIWTHMPFGDVFYASNTLKVFEVLRKGDYSVLILNSIFSRFTLVSLMHQIIFRDVKKIYLYPRGELSQKALRNKFFLKWFYLKYFLCPVVSFLDIQIISTSNIEQSDVEALFQHVTPVVPNIPRKNTNGKISKLKPDIRLIFVGRLDPMKGLVEFIMSLPKDVPLNFDIVGPKGDTYYYHQLVSAIKQVSRNGMNIRMLGYKSWKELEEIYHEYSFIVLPSHSENFGHSLTEGMSYGLVPITTTGVPYHNEIIRNESGYCINPEDWTESVKNIFKKIQSLRESDYRKMQSRNLEYLRNEQDVVIKATKKYYGLH